MHHLGPRVLVLARARERDREGLAPGVLAHQVDRRVLHRHLGADVAVDPLHRRALLGDGALGHQVVHVVRPVLDRGVTAARVLLHDDLDHRGMQRVGLVNGRGAALHVMDVGALVHDDQGPLELAHVLGVDPEIGLQRDFHLYVLRHVDERAAGPYRGVQRGELVVARRNHRAEVLAEQIRLLPQRGVRVEEDDALFLEVFPDLVVDDLGLVLGGHARDEPLLFRLGDAEPVVGVLDIGGQLVPARGLLLGGADEVLDVVEVDFRQVGAPGGQRLAAEVLQALQPHARASTPARSCAPRCHGPPLRTGRGARTRRPRPSRPSRTCTCPALRAVLAWWSCQEPSGLCGDFGRYTMFYNSFGQAVFPAPVT